MDYFQLLMAGILRSTTLRIYMSLLYRLCQYDLVLNLDVTDCEPIFFSLADHPWMHSSQGIADSAAQLIPTRHVAPQLGPRMPAFMAPPLPGASMMGSTIPYSIMPLPSQPPPVRPPEPPGIPEIFLSLYLCSSSSRLTCQGGHCF